MNKIFLVDFMCPLHGQQYCKQIEESKLFETPQCKAWLHDDTSQAFQCEYPLRIRVVGEVE